MTDAGEGIRHSRRRLLLVPWSRIRRPEGVDSVESGYMGCKTVNPSYEEVCSGETGTPRSPTQLRPEAGVIQGDP